MKQTLIRQSPAPTARFALFVGALGPAGDLLAVSADRAFLETVAARLKAEGCEAAIVAL